MKSSQINFYLMPEDIFEIEKYIKDNNLSIYSNHSLTKEPDEIISLLNSNPMKYISISKHKPLIKNQFIEKQNYYSIDVIESPVVEIYIPKNLIKDNKLYSGRLYYIKNYYNENKKYVEKPSEFIDSANDLFKWVKKHFKSKMSNYLSGYEMYLISERTNFWLKNNSGKLGNEIEPTYQKSKKIA